MAISEEEHAEHEHRWLAVVAFVAILAIGLSVATLILSNRVEKNTNRVGANTERIASDIVAGRRTDFKICSREMIDRAVLIGVIDGTLPPVRGLRLLNCSPNLVGKPATPLSAAQKRRFLHYVQNATSLP